MHKVLSIYLIILIILLYYFFRKNINGFFIRRFNIKTRKNYTENYTVVKKYNYDPKKNVIISMSLFGNLDNEKKREKYYNPILENNEILSRIPNSNYRIYIDPTIPKKYVNVLIEKGYEVFVMNAPSKKLSGTVWRFLAFEDKNPDGIVFISDSDSITGKDYTFNNALQTDFQNIEYIIDFMRKTNVKYVIRGSNMVYTPFSANKIVMGKGIIQNMNEKINKYSPQRYGEDEVFLKEEIWPLMKNEGYKRLDSPKENIGVIVAISTIPIIIVILVTAIVLNLCKKF